MKTVFTCGCFDLIHYRHVSFLERAAEFGRLIVSVNSDASVRRLKGMSRPIIPAEARAAMLRSLEFVSSVVIDDDDTPDNLLRSIRPDIFIKGDGNDSTSMAGATTCRELGIEIVVLPNVVIGESTSEIIERIRWECP